MPNQNPSDDSGANAMGRWDYGPWFWPPLTTSLVHGPTPAGDPGTPNPSLVPEAFMDTPIVNGTAYPYLKVERKAYRFRILNASNDRTLNLQLYFAKSNVSTNEGVMKPVYRFYNATSGSHFYTASLAERDSTIANLSATYHYEGVAYSINTSDPDNSAPLYRFYNMSNGSHFYTASMAERDTIIATLSSTYHYDGVAYNVSTIATGNQPVWRFYNTKNGSHFYTASLAERDSTIANLSSTYTYEGIAFYIASGRVLQTDSGEVPMVEASPHPNDPTWPSTWPTDGRDGGVPSPAARGPKFIQIGTEGGLLPKPVVLDNQPVGYNYNRRDIVVLNIANKTLMLGPAERADVVVDFSGVPAGSKIIMYNDAPAPVPAFDTRLDYYTGDPDQTSTGGAPTTRAGYGPNTRTVMQFQVGGPASAPLDLGALDTGIQTAYKASQEPPIVPQTAYGNTTVDTYARIQSTSLTFTPEATTTPINIPMQPKAIQELFELNYGRMNATLGVELPFTNFNTQTTIPLGYLDPLTENMVDSVTPGPVVSSDGTQIWKITHNGVDTHAIHFHLFNVQVINRVGWDGAIRPPDPNELGWKETVRMNPLEDCIVAMKPVAPTLPFKIGDSIRPLDPTLPVGQMISVTSTTTGNAITVPNALTNFGWEYVWHCHLLGHEENDMMRPIRFAVSPERTHESRCDCGGGASGVARMVQHLDRAGRDEQPDRKGDGRLIHDRSH